MHSVAASLVAALTIVGARAQGPAPVFEAASIRENDSGRDGGGATPLSNGRWQATNAPLRSLIAIAWELPTDRVLNAPEWTRLRKFDITAVTSPDAKQAQLPAMLKALLRDRFQLAAHLERRELPTYNLVVVRSDGRLGPALRKAPIDNCFDAAQRAAAAALTPPARPCGITFEVGHYSGTVQLGDLVGMLSSASGRPVFDRTGLTGNYEFDIRWSPLSGDTAAADAVSIFTALQEQLGLKLESSSAPLDVLVVDRVERPTAN